MTLLLVKEKIPTLVKYSFISVAGTVNLFKTHNVPHYFRINIVSSFIQIKLEIKPNKFISDTSRNVCICSGTKSTFAFYSHDVEKWIKLTKARLYAFKRV